MAGSCRDKLVFDTSSNIQDQMYLPVGVDLKFINRREYCEQNYLSACKSFRSRLHHFRNLGGVWTVSKVIVKGQVRTILPLYSHN